MLLSPVHASRVGPAPYIHSLLHPYCASQQTLLDFPAPPSLLPLDVVPVSFLDASLSFLVQQMQKVLLPRLLKKTIGESVASFIGSTWEYSGKDLRIEIMTMVTPN